MHEDRGNRWVLVALTLIGLLNGYLPACTRLEFQKRSQLFIGTHDETRSIIAVCVNNPDCAPFAIQS